jgi:hypothetical protein
MLNKRAEYASRKFDTPLVSPHWPEAVATLQGILTYPPFQHNTRLYGDFKYLASLTVGEGKPVAAGYAARKAYRQSMAIQEELEANFIGGNPDPDFLYVMRDSEFLKYYSQMIGRFWACNWDGYKVFLAKNAKVAVSNHYGDLTRVHLSDYLRQSYDKLLFVLITHRADNIDCSVYHEMFDLLESPPDSTAHCGSYLSVVRHGDVVQMMSHEDEAICLDLEPGHTWDDFYLDRYVSMASHGELRPTMMSIRVDGREEAFNTEGVCIVALDLEQDLVEVAHFPGVRGGEGFVLPINRP